MTQTGSATTTMRERLDAIEAEAFGEQCFTAERIQTAAQLRAASLKPAAPPEAAHPLQSGEITDTWINQTVDVEDRKVHLERQRGVLLTLARDAGQQAAQLRSAAQPRIISAYQRELTRLLDDVQAISDDLGDVTTAGKAIAADLGQTWKQLSTLADDYAELRSAQLARVDAQTKFAASPDFPGEPHASDLYLANLDDIWPNWRRGGDDHVVQLGGTHNVARREPWPADATELMLWLVRSDAEPWIPGATDLNTLNQKRRDAHNNPDPDPS